MASRKQTLDKLGEYAATGSFDSNPDQLLKLHKDEGDRGLVIILASQLEDALLERILQDLKKGTENRRSLEKGGPLRSYEQRIVLARAMGILTEREAEIFDVFRHMRNACAHSRREISFQTPELREALILLSPESRDLLTGEQPKLDAAAVVIFIAAWLLSFLTGLSHKQTRNRFENVMKMYVAAKIESAQPDGQPSSSLKKSNSKPSRGSRQAPSGKGR